MIFGINTTSDISKLLYVKFETILKYHEWYLCQISGTNLASPADILRGASRIPSPRREGTRDALRMSTGEASTNHAIIWLYYYPQKVCNLHM